MSKYTLTLTNDNVSASLGVLTGSGPAGRGWTGVTYDTNTGQFTFTSNDGLGYVSDSITADLDTAVAAAEAAQAATESLFDQFGDQYLGALATEPTVDNDGDPLTTGDIFFDTTESVLKFYNGVSWFAPETVSSEAATQAQASAAAAATSETNAATSETNAANSATAAANSETNAVQSSLSAAGFSSSAEDWASIAAGAASDAATSESNAANSANSATNSATSASISEANATSSESAAATSETNADTSATAAATSATAAAASATAAATSETNAATSETNAANSATSAATSASNAQTAADTALSALDSFDDRYLGQKASDPTTDNDGDPLVAGALYFNTTDDAMRVYEGSVWVAAYASLSGALLSANNLSDLLNAATARTNLGLGTAATSASSDFIFSSGGYTYGPITQAMGNETTIVTATSGFADQTLWRADGLNTGAIRFIHNYSDDSFSVNMYNGGAYTDALSISQDGTVTADGLTVTGDSEIKSTSPTLYLTESDTVDTNIRFRVVNGDLFLGGVNDSLVNTGYFARFEQGGNVSFYDFLGSNPSFFWDASAESLGIGTDTPQRIIHTYSPVPAIRLEDSNIAGLYHEIVGTATGQVQFKVDAGNVEASSSLAFVIDGTEKAKIDESGNLLVGTTSITSPIVNGGTAGVVARANGQIYAGAYDTQVVTLNRSTSDGDIAQFRRSGSTVGSIGTTVSDLTIGKAGAALRFNGGNNDVIPWNVSTNAASTNTDLGNSSNLFKDLYLSGTANAANFNTTSDATLKTNVETLTGSLDAVKALRGVSFDWVKSGNPEVGVIAQEVEAVIPELVSTNDQGIKSVKYGNLVAVLIEAIKEQQAQIDELKAKLGD